MFNSVDIGIANAETVLRCLLREGPLPRVALAELTGLNRATVTRVASRLLEIGLLREQTVIRTNSGRPLTPLEIAGFDRVVATVHFGAAEIRFAIVRLDGTIVAKDAADYVDTSPAAALAQAATGIIKLCNATLTDQLVLGLGAAVNGTVDSNNGLVVAFDPLGWSNVEVARDLNALVPWPVLLEQTVRGMALAEGMFGVASRSTDFLQLWIGNVLNAAIVSNSQIRRGPQGAAGLIGHLPAGASTATTLSSIASDSVILPRTIATGALKPGAGMQEFVEAAPTDPRIRAITDDVAAALAQACIPIVDFLNPETVVLSGLITETPHFGDVFTQGIAANRAQLGVRVPQIVVSRFGDEAASIGASAVVLDAFYRNPFADGVAFDFA